MANTVINLKMRLNELGVTLDSLKEGTVEMIQSAVRTIAHAAKAMGVQMSQDKLNKTGPAWRSGFDLQEVGDDIYIISLTGDYANDLDTGYPSYDMKSQIFKRNWKFSKKGYPYAVVPMEHQPFSQSGGSQKVQDLRDAIKVLIKDKGLDKIVIDPKTGKRKIGNVGSIGNVGNKNIDRITKYQTPTGSHYMAFRTMSMNPSQSNSWIHPGFKGVHIMDELEKFIDQQIDEVLSKTVSFGEM